MNRRDFLLTLVHGAVAAGLPLPIGMAEALPSMPLALTQKEWVYHHIHNGGVLTEIIAGSEAELDRAVSQYWSTGHAARSVKAMLDGIPTPTLKMPAGLSDALYKNWRDNLFDHEPYDEEFWRDVWEELPRDPVSVQGRKGIV